MKKITGILTFSILFLAPELLAEPEGQALHYLCEGRSDSVYQVNIKIPGQSGFVQLAVPVTNGGTISLSEVKNCLLRMGVLSQEAIREYENAVTACRDSYHTNKVKVSGNQSKSYSTADVFDFEACLSQRLPDR